MKLMINKQTSHTLYTPEKAEEIVKELNVNDPDWTYKVKYCPKGTGFSIIEIYDEDNFLMGYY